MINFVFKVCCCWFGLGKFWVMVVRVMVLFVDSIVLRVINISNVNGILRIIVKDELNSRLKLNMDIGEGGGL